jgi:hypothetical protein
MRGRTARGSLPLGQNGELFVGEGLCAGARPLRFVKENVRMFTPPCRAALPIFNDEGRGKNAAWRPNDPSPILQPLPRSPRASSLSRFRGFLLNRRRLRNKRGVWPENYSKSAVESVGLGPTAIGGQL